MKCFRCRLLSLEKREEVFTPVTVTKLIKTVFLIWRPLSCSFAMNEDKKEQALYYDHAVIQSCNKSLFKD